MLSNVAFEFKLRRYTKAAEIVAAKSKKTAADALDLLNAAKLFQKTAQESLDAENARNKVGRCKLNQ